MQLRAPLRVWGATAGKRSLRTFFFPPLFSLSFILLSTPLPRLALSGKSYKKTQLVANSNTGSLRKRKHPQKNHRTRLPPASSRPFHRTPSENTIQDDAMAAISKSKKKHSGSVLLSRRRSAPTAVRPVTAVAQSSSLSSKAGRALIRSHHTLQKNLSQALSRNDEATACTLRAEIEASGGLEKYQLASVYFSPPLFPPPPRTPDANLGIWS